MYKSKSSRETVDRKRRCLCMEWKKKEYGVIEEWMEGKVFESVD